MTNKQYLTILNILKTYNFITSDHKEYVADSPNDQYVVRVFLDLENDPHYISVEPMESDELLVDENWTKGSELLNICETYLEEVDEDYPDDLEYDTAIANNYDTDIPELELPEPKETNESSKAPKWMLDDLAKLEAGRDKIRAIKQKYLD